MNNYAYLLQLHESGRVQGSEYKCRLKRLIAGYHATQFFFKKLISSDAHVADVGCYYGQWSYPLLEKVKEVTFLDYKDEHFSYLKTLFGAHTINAHLVTHDFCQEPFPWGGGEKRFDVILCMGTLDYIDPMRFEVFCQNMLDTIKDGGYILLDIRDAQKLWFYQQFILQPFRIQMIKEYFKPFAKNLFRKYSRHLINLWFMKKLQPLLGSFYSRVIRDSNIEQIQKILKRNGLLPVPLTTFIDREVYEMCRGIEGFNLTNTFVGNYFWLGLYQKPKNISL